MTIIKPGTSNLWWVGKEHTCQNCAQVIATQFGDQNDIDVLVNDMQYIYRCINCRDQNCINRTKEDKNAPR